MSRTRRAAMPHALASLAALTAVSLGAALVPLSALDADAAPSSVGSAHAKAKCHELKSAKARKKCRREAKGNASAAASGKPTPTAAAQPTATPTTTAPSVSSVSSATATTTVPAAPVSTPPSLLGLVSSLSGAEVIPQLPAAGIFSPLSEWNRDLSSAPVAADSAGLVANLAQQVAALYGGVAAFNVWQYNVSAYTVGPSVPRADVIWDNCQRRTYTPGELYSSARGAHFKNVPIPADALPATGTDGQLTVYSPATDQLWEFWKAKKQSDGWHACWGGRIDSVSTNKGWFPNGMGVGATGLTSVGGAISISEAQALKINHALSVGVPQAAHRSTFSYPAQRSDGNLPIGTPFAIQEGQRFRLDPSIDVSKLKLTPVAKAIAVAAQKYGFIVDNVAGAVGVGTESGKGVVAAGGTNPWTAVLNGTPSYLMMKNFPWDKLQAMPLNYGA